jgi:hypothetical protein
MRRFLPALGLAAALAGLACSKETPTRIPVNENRSPEILGVDVNPQRVLAFHEIRVNCRARDKDNDRLHYEWEATGGTFPLGSQSSTVRWKSPAVGKQHTIRVSVSDLEETTSSSLVVPIVGILPPDTLTFTNGANLVTLFWPPSIDNDLEGWSGYEVFASDRDLADVPAEELAPYRLTSEPITRTEYRVSFASPGARKFYKVISRRDYEGVVERSSAGPQIETAPPVTGLNRDPLYEIGSRRGRSAVHLPGGEVEVIDPALKERFDFYLGTSSETDAGGALQLKSPSRLAYIEPSWAGRTTLFREVPEDWSGSIPPRAPDGYADVVPAKQGVVYAVYTAEGHYAKLRVLELRGASPERRIEFQWAWQPIEDYPRY